MTNMSIHNCVEERFDDIKHADYDNNSYRGLVLTNKMKILLISNPSTSISIASLDVNNGYMRDPDDLPGLAHLCEHLLNMGTEEYPQQNDVNKYMWQYGGHYNAYTNIINTNYNFTINPKKLEGALHRLAQFFIKPLFRETLIEKEIICVHSEYKMKLTNDNRRFCQLEKLSVKPDHPYSKFSTGNIETLSTIPKERDIRKRLLEFYNTYYSANIMSLCVLGQESLDDLENMVIECFRHVQNKEVEVPMCSELPLKDEEYGTIWYYVPIADVRYLYTSFSLLEKDKYRMPVKYITHLLGHKGKGSLLSALNARGWCNDVYVWEENAQITMNCIRVIFDLTEQGPKNIDNIVQLMFQYINMLKENGPIEWIYKECQHFANIMNSYINWSLDNIMETAFLLHNYPIKELVVRVKEDFPEWRQDLVEELMKYFTPKNIRIHVAAKAFENITNETESWYGIKYKKEKIPEKTLKMWSSDGYSENLKLPSKNEFIPTKLDIKTSTNVEKFPIILKNTSFVRLWYKKDDVFCVPKAKMIFHFISPFACVDLLSCNLTDMFVMLIRDSLYEYTYAAGLAGLEWKTTRTKFGITLAIDGYDDKQRVLVEKIMDKMMNFKINPERFEILKDIHIRNIKNFDAVSPNFLETTYLRLLSSEHDWPCNELLEFTSLSSMIKALINDIIEIFVTCVDLSVDRLQRFIPKLFSKMHVECLIYGNVTEMEATDTVELIESMLKTGRPHIEPLQGQLVLYRQIKLEDGCHILFEEETKLHGTNCTIVYYETGLQSTMSNMLLALLEHIIFEPCYNILRTTEQLGYRVRTGIYTMSGVQYLIIQVHGVQPPRYVEQRIDSFIDFMFDNHIPTMPKEQFEKYKEDLVLYIEEPYSTFINQGSFYWEEIESQEYNFDRHNIEGAYLRTITQQQLLNFFEENICGNARRKLSVHSISTATLTENNLPNKPGKITVRLANNKVEEFDDIMTFKNSQSLYPLPKPFDKNFLRKGLRF